jgi:hypothetical protein
MAHLQAMFEWGQSFSECVPPTRHHPDFVHFASTQQPKNSGQVTEVRWAEGSPKQADAARASGEGIESLLRLTKCFSSTDELLHFGSESTNVRTLLQEVANDPQTMPEM